MSIFINFSNHPSENWEDIQKKQALRYGNILDVPFPNVEENLTEQEVKNLAEKYIEEILNRHPAAVMVQGEFTLTFYVVSKLLERGIKCFAACTKRLTEEEKMPDGSIVKKSRFHFEGFREYQK